MFACPTLRRSFFRGSSVLEAGSPTESVRDFLMQKRSSLTHTPDVVRVLQKLEAQHAGAADVHEFQKVNGVDPIGYIHEWAKVRH